MSSDTSWSASRKKREDHGNRPKSDAPKQQPSQVRRSFVPPVRDEESETQRKAHAKRVRETRRSTQGVTLEDLKSAEQLVKKKQQQENQQRTSELQQLVASQQQQQKYSPTTVPSVSIQQPSSGSSSAASSITALSTSTSAVPSGVTSGSTSSIASNASLAGDTTDRHERRPSWRLRLDTSDKNKFRLEEDSSRSGNKNQNNALTALARKGSKYESSRSSGDHTSSPSIPENVEVPSVTITSSSGLSSTTSSTAASASPSTLQPSNHRRKKPKRRSTGVVNLDVDDLDGGESAEEESSISGNADNVAGSGSENPNISSMETATAATTFTNKSSNNNTSVSAVSMATNHIGGTERSTSATDRSQNGEIDYRKLWEQSQMENSRLRDDLSKTRDELSAAKKKLDTVDRTPVTTSGLTDTEKKEKLALEKKLSEMEEELKQLEHLKNDNQRLRDENGALIRVISKLSK